MTQTADTVDTDFVSAANPKTARRPSRTSLFPWRRWDIILGSISLNIFSLLLPILVLQLYDRIIPNKSYSALILMGCGVVLAATLEAILRYSHSRVLSWLGVHFENVAMVGAFDHLTKTTSEGFKQQRVEEHVENIESIPILREFLAGQGFLVLLDIPFMFLYLGIIAYFSMTIAMVPIILLILFVSISVILAKHLKQALAEQLNLDDQRYNFITEALTNHHTVKAMGMEELLLRRYERVHTQCSQVTYKINRYSTEIRDLANLCTYFMFGGIIGIGALEVINGNATIGIMSASIILASRAIKPIQTAIGMLTRFQHFSIAKHRLKEIFNAPIESTNQNKIHSQIQGHIKIENLSFQYPSGIKLLDTLNLEIVPGQVVTIYGKNGVGKSTLMHLIAGLITPTGEGTILIDGHPMEDYNPDILRKQIIYVPPKSNLFQGTILDNITLFQGEDLANEAFSLAGQLGLDDWINRLPQGYDTKIGDSLFLTLPEGIHQRICLIRALITHPKILILDEAHTALDEKGECSLKGIIHKLRGDTTILLVAHHPSIREIADVSYELVNGRLVKHQLDNQVNRPASSLYTLKSSKPFSNGAV